MQVYTKILIGMIVGALVGLLLGPNSPWLPANVYRVAQTERLDLQIEDAPFSVPTAPGSAISRPLKLRVVEIERDSIEDTHGGRHLLPVRSTVELRWNQHLALLDRDGTVHARLGRPAIGEARTLVMNHEHIALDGGGFVVWPVPQSDVGHTVLTVVRPIGDAFMRLIKMVIVPLVFASLLVGVASLGDIRKLGRLGFRTLALYLVTTAVAVSIGLVCAHVLQPGRAVAPRARVALQAQFESAAGDQVERATEAPSTIENLLNIIPENPIASLVQGDMLQVIFFAVLLGIALTLLDDKHGRPVVALMDRLQSAMVVIIHMVMKVAPYGVAALLADVVGTSGLSVLGGLLFYGLTVLLGLAIHGALTYGFLVRKLAKLPFIAFVRAIRPAQLIAFSTSSSSATLPVSMECAEENVGVSNAVSSFVLPLGSTINMDGTALYQGVAAVFIAQVFQMDLSMADQLAIVATATIASIGAAGVPGAGMVTLAMVLTTAGIPAVGVALILGLDRILDMFRTALNVTGDLAVTAVMARAEGDDLQLLTPQADAADPKRGFENRLEKPQARPRPDR